MCSGGVCAPDAKCMAGYPIIMAACCCSMAAGGYCPNELLAELYMSAAAPTIDAMPESKGIYVQVKRRAVVGFLQGHFERT